MAHEPRLTHVGPAGVRMVDVSDKPVTARRAIASARITLGREAFELLSHRGVPKGDVLTTAKVAGILAAKRTAELIPLCHGIAPEHVDVRIDPAPPDSLLITVETRVQARTGCEVDALLAASVAALTVYDMCKSASKAITIGPIRLEHKAGGRSGEYHAPAGEPPGASSL